MSKKYKKVRKTQKKTWNSKMTEHYQKNGIKYKPTFLYPWGSWKEIVYTRILSVTFQKRDDVIKIRDLIITSAKDVGCTTHAQRGTREIRTRCEIYDEENPERCSYLKYIKHSRKDQWESPVTDVILESWLYALTEILPYEYNNNNNNNNNNRNITHHKESATSWDLKPEWWGSPLAQEQKCQGRKKTCDKKLWWWWW
jgi:hypothetical protein